MNSAICNWHEICIIIVSEYKKEVHELGKLKVANIQMDCKLGDKEENLYAAEKLVFQAIQHNAELIVLPELFNTGYRVEEADPEYAESDDGDTVKWMKTISQKHHVYLCACLLENTRKRGLVYDTAYLTGPEGLIGKYRKISLWNQEKNRFTPGNELPVFNLGFVTVGLQICYEVGFPEPARVLSEKGADIIIYSSAFGRPRLYAWDLATRARALENGVFVIASNRIGVEKGETEFAGHSRIIDPQGTIIDQLKNKQSIIVSEIDVDDVQVQRQKLPYLRDYCNYETKGSVR